MKTFREFVDQKEPFQTPVLPGQLKNATNRYGNAWDKASAQNPNAFLQNRKMRPMMGGTFNQFGDLAKNRQELDRVHRQGKVALKQMYDYQKNRLEQ